MLGLGVLGVIRGQIANSFDCFYSGRLEVQHILEPPGLIGGGAFTIASLAHNLLGLGRLQK